MRSIIRTPNIKKSIKARTTGKLKRKVKSTVNPLYNKKGIDYITDPKKAIYNKVYHKTSWSIFDLFKGDFLLHVALFFLTVGIGNVILLIYRHKQKTRQND